MRWSILPSHSSVPFYIELVGLRWWCWVSSAINAAYFSDENVFSCISNALCALQNFSKRWRSGLKGICGGCGIARGKTAGVGSNGIVAEMFFGIGKFEIKVRVQHLSFPLWFCLLILTCECGFRVGGLIAIGVLPIYKWLYVYENDWKCYCEAETYNSLNQIEA